MAMTTFPIGSSVLLKGLVKGAQFNGKQGIVKSLPNASGRQEVYVVESQKSLAVKIENISYEPRALSSLSVSEMKRVLRASEKRDRDPKEWEGMSKDELRAAVSKAIATEDPEEIAALVALAPPSSSAGGASSTGDALRQGAERMSQMDPDEIRRQAATMKSMGPAALRAMHPQMAALTDEQIQMAVAQMEAVAANPDQLKMMADQMKGASESELRRAMQHQGPLAPQAGPPKADATSSSNANVNANISQSQFTQATQQLSSMSPDQLRQQAQMLKSMPRDQLRRSNPQMAHMTDAQIDMSINQMDMMAQNPAVLQMAAEQMKNMTSGQFESMKGLMGGPPPGAAAGGREGEASGSGAPAAAAGPSGLLADPSKVMEAFLGNPEQLNGMLKMMKQNPDMMKQMMASQMGIHNKENGGTDSAKREQLEKLERAVDSFANMDDVQLERYLKMANRVQKMTKPMLTLFAKVKDMLGVSAKSLMVGINVLGLVSGILLVRWWKLKKGSDYEDDNILDTDLSPGSEEYLGVSYGQSEF